MKTIAMLASICALPALAFGAWGRFTAAGRLQFDEMAGILPFISWYAGWGLAALAAFCRGWLAWRRNSPSTGSATEDR